MVRTDLVAAYREMAQDEIREAEATIADVADDLRETPPGLFDATDF
jgi:hypothetical protein